MEGGCLGALLPGATHVKEEPECALTDRDVVKEEVELQNLDIECMKEESSCEDAVSLNEVSEAALASLYLDHVVKDELVLGPEDFHRMNIADVLHEKDESRRMDRGIHTTHMDTDGENKIDYDREPRCDLCSRRFALKSDLMKHVIIHIEMSTSTEMEDDLGVGGNGGAPGCNPGEERLSRDCSVRLERLPPRETRAQPDGEPRTQHELYTRVDYDREPICDICGSRFALKSDLMKHVVVHIHMAVSAELGEGMLVADAKSPLIIPDGCAQPVARARSSRHALRDCCVRLERLPALERRAPPHAPPPRPPHTLHNTAGTETYICDTCSKIFQQKQDLIRHIQCHSRNRSSPNKTVKNKNKPFSCICGKQFEHRVQLKIHNRIHTGETPYPCDICGEQFAYCTSLQLHKRIHTGEKPYACKICLKQFKGSGDLKQHSRTHTGKKLYSCSTCNKQFSSLVGFNTHTLKHKGEYPLCELCDKRFLTFKGLKVHNKRSHEGVSCKICSEHFVSVESFKIHKRSVHNTGGPLYTCNVCKMKFVNTFNYEQHFKRIHTGERPHSCEICGKRFTRLAHLQVHTRYHTGEKRFSCDICGKQFFEKHTLVCHERAQHTGEKPYSCDICQKRFTRKTHLNSHMKVHTGVKAYACEICDKRFALMNTLRLHYRLHTGETPYSCEFCGKQFVQSSSLASHTRIHTGEKPYSCEICKKTFRHLKSAKSHRLSHELNKNTTAI